MRTAAITLTEEEALWLARTLRLVMEIGGQWHSLDESSTGPSLARKIQTARMLMKSEPVHVTAEANAFCTGPCCTERTVDNKPAEAGLKRTATQFQYAELERMAVEWIKNRDSLSSDCAKLGISSRLEDMPKWQDELNRREQPFRRFMERWVWEIYTPQAHSTNG